MNMTVPESTLHAYNDFLARILSPIAILHLGNWPELSRDRVCNFKFT
jgi:hypothetical protein